MKRWAGGALAALLALTLAAAAAWAWVQRPLAMAGDTAEVAIELGMSPRDIAQAWVKAGIDTSPRWLYEWFRWSGQARKIRAGSYEAQRGATPASLLGMMVRGDEAQAVVRLIEGWTLRQFRAELARAEALKPTTAALSDAELMAALGEPAVAAEGRFFPDPYPSGTGRTDLSVLRRANRAMRRHLDEAWADRAPELPLRSADDVLTLASIIEKETGSAADRARVAAVFINRLRLGMPLQTDPTVIYGLGTAFDGNLRRRDLQTDTPYNTYTRAGLPPTPIAMTGRASLFAAVHPSPTRDLYFVARGDGSSEFSDNLAAHNRAVDRFQRGR